MVCTSCNLIPKQLISNVCFQKDALNDLFPTFRISNPINIKKLNICKAGLTQYIEQAPRYKKRIVRKILICPVTICIRLCIRHHNTISIHPTSGRKKPHHEDVNIQCILYTPQHHVFFYSAFSAILLVYPTIYHVIKFLSALL